MQGHLLWYNSAANVRTDHSGSDYEPDGDPDSQPDFDSNCATHFQSDGDPNS